MAVMPTIKVKVVTQPRVRIKTVPQPKIRMRATPALIPADGEAATIEVGTVTTLPYGSPAAVTNVGTENAAVFNFAIPEGAPGAGQVESVNGQQGVVVLDADDIDDTSTINKFATAAELALVASALQPSAIGVSVQAYDADLAAWAGVNPSSYSTTAQIAAAYQPLDSDLTAIAGLTRTRGDLIVGGASAWTDLALGTSGYALKSDGTDAVWAASREVLTAARTYYVRTDGSDSNNGLANTSGGAFLTIQKALNVAATLDFNGFIVTVQVADGTYTGSNTIPRCVGMASPTALVIQGNSGTPGNVIISTTGADCFTTAALASANVKDMELRTTTSGSCISPATRGYLAFSNIRFGACAASNVLAAFGGYAIASGNYAIVGAAARHWHSDGAASQIEVAARTITITGTPAFSDCFARAGSNALIRGFSNTYSGSATGTRYLADTGGGIQTFGAGATALPGNAGGTATSPGWYA